jgi:hypothetical protein
VTFNHEVLGSNPRGGMTETRECKNHGIVDHHWIKAKGYTAGGRWRCKRCIGESVLRRKQLVKQTLINEAGGACAFCGYNRCHRSLQFHHLDPTQKSMRMDMGNGRSLAAFREEAKKCILVCANCHGEIEHGMIVL